MSVRNRKMLEEFDYPKVEIDYPESDGKPMAETDKHRDLMTALIGSLRNHFADAKDVYVSGNLLLYYVEGDLDKNVAPDVFVVRGVGKHDRRTYYLWEEQHAPSVVIEVSSRSTKKEDLNWKKQLYAWLGVREYFIFDPEYKLKPPLRAYRLRGGQFVEEAVTGGRVLSKELGLELVNTGKTLRLLDPRTNRFLLTPEEEAIARRQAEAARQDAEAARGAEAAARQRAEAEVERLRAELAHLKRSTPKKRGK
ncbi:MAG: Uma2 family endonuclease [Blastocatellia bacterium]